MKIKEIKTDKAPGAIGPYSQAIQASNLLFTSGQIPIDPETGNIIEGGIEEQTEQVLKNLRAILKAGGSGPDKVLKVTVYLDDIKNFELMNKVYSSHFDKSKPARSCVEVSALPRGVMIEIDAIALV